MPSFGPLGQLAKSIYGAGTSLGMRTSVGAGAGALGEVVSNWNQDQTLGDRLGSALGGAIFGGAIGRYGTAAFNRARSVNPINMMAGARKEAFSKALGAKGAFSHYGRAMMGGAMSQMRRDWQGATLLANQGINRIFALK